MAAFEGDGGSAGVPTDVAACIAFYAPALMGRPGESLSEAVAFVLGREAGADVVRGASPITYASGAFPPTMLITGNRDELVPDESSFLMYRALADAGAKAELHVYEGAPHAFDALPDFGRQCASIMALFLDRQVARPREVSIAAVAAARG
jgi:acetyl esterase/lipase